MLKVSFCKCYSHIFFVGVMFKYSCSSLGSPCIYASLRATCLHDVQANTEQRSSSFTTDAAFDSNIALVPSIVASYYQKTVVAFPGQGGSVFICNRNIASTMCVTHQLYGLPTKA